MKAGTKSKISITSSKSFGIHGIALSHRCAKPSYAVDENSNIGLTSARSDEIVP
jgi:hypothetical protein